MAERYNLSLKEYCNAGNRLALFLYKERCFSAFRASYLSSTTLSGTARTMKDFHRFMESAHHDARKLRRAFPICLTVQGNDYWYRIYRESVRYMKKAVRK